GSGNDVGAALANGAKTVDAVEIDPAIYDIGRAEHPNHPYQDPRVTVHIDDGRSFVRKTHGHYDLIIYALVDSLVLHSGYSSRRRWRLPPGRTGTGSRRRLWTHRKSTACRPTTGHSSTSAIGPFPR